MIMLWAIAHVPHTIEHVLLGWEYAQCAAAHVTWPPEHVLWFIEHFLGHIERAFCAIEHVLGPQSTLCGPYMVCGPQNVFYGF